MTASLKLQAGGTLRPGKHVYIERPEDQVLLHLLLEGEYVNVLTSRQMGKSSLMVRTKNALSERGIRTASVDLVAELETAADAETYFRSLLKALAEKLKIQCDIAEFRAAHPDDTPGQWFQRFFREVACSQAQEPCCIFLDEIDSTLKFQFTDGLFTAIRGMYNERALEPAYQRIMCCLLGVATPNELIKDRRSTAYNVGVTLELRDFDPTHDDLTPLVEQLAGNPGGEAMLERVLYWTGGHPFLTVKVCADLKAKRASGPRAVDDYVESAFTSLERLNSDVHFQSILRFVQTRLSHGIEALRVYRRVLMGERVQEQTTSSHLELKLSGLVKRDADGRLAVRNPIYARLFDKKWVESMEPMREVVRSQKRWITASAVGALVLALTGYLAYTNYRTAQEYKKLLCGGGSGTVRDEALCVGRTAETFPSADEDYFRDMDYGVTRDAEAVAVALSPYLPGILPQDAVNVAVTGRNTWMVWTGGNDRFWDLMAKDSTGVLDFLKLLSNHPSSQNNRDTRWEDVGLVNEPCFEKGAGPRQDRYGLWLDVRRDNCPPDPFENELKYPGAKMGARGKNIPIGSYYGYATGIVGLRLFPNPDFDENAERRWDPKRYYTDPTYYRDKSLVRPYRVGVSCAFCHVGPNPTKPPRDPENPKWEHLNSNSGAQYLGVDRIFTGGTDDSLFLYQLFRTSRPGALDTSLVPTDYINNPRTINALYNLGARLALAMKLGKETVVGGELNNAQLAEYFPRESVLSQFFQAPDTVWTPRFLKDGADSTGTLAALNRFFVNIGLFSEEWLEHFKPLVGGQPVTPFDIATADKNSTYWNATKEQTQHTALFLLATTGRADYLINAPGGRAYLTTDMRQLVRGKAVFAERCARCHSSKLPEKAFDFFPNGGCVGPGYLKCWNDYWEWTKTTEFKKKMNEIVLADDFLSDNFLSTDLRVPITLLETNACASLATNAIAGNIWDNFSSASYKNLPSVGSITMHHPITGEPREYLMPGGGRGYIRPSSLVSVWSTAPFLLNNTLGAFYWTGSVEDRMKSFDIAIGELLWPEKRRGDRKYKTASGKALPGIIDVTTARSYLRIPSGYVPDYLELLVRSLEGIEIGPIPKGIPIDLLSNMDLERKLNVVKVLQKMASYFKTLPKGASDEEARKRFADVVEPLLQINKCPDFVVNRGHYFGTDYSPAEEKEPGLSDEDKLALIEFVKTM